MINPKRKRCVLVWNVSLADDGKCCIVLEPYCVTFIDSVQGLYFNNNELLFCSFSLLIISCIGTIYIFSHLFQGILVASGQSAYFHETEYAWIFRLGINCFGYASIFVPGFLIHKYVRKTKYLERSGK